MFDIKEEQLESAKKDIARDVDEFQADGTLRGTLSAAEQKKMINTTTSLAECVKASRTNNMNILFLNMNYIISFPGHHLHPRERSREPGAEAQDLGSDRRARDLRPDHHVHLDLVHRALQDLGLAQASRTVHRRPSRKTKAMAS